MATDFNSNTTSSKGGFKPSVADTPLDIRTRIETIDDVASIPLPYIGMIFYVKDTGKRYEVLTLKDKKMGIVTTKNALVDEYRELPYVTKEALSSNLEGKADADHTHNYEDLEGLPEIPSIDGLATEQYVDDAIAAIQPQQPDLSNLATKEDLKGKADKAHVHGVEDIIDLELPTKVSDLENDANYATESYVANAIAEAQLNGGDTEVDLSGLATKDDLNTKVDKVEGKGLSTNDFTNELKSAIQTNSSKVIEIENNLMEFNNALNAAIQSNTNRIAAIENTFVKTVSYDQNITFKSGNGNSVFEIGVVDSTDIETILDFN